MDVGGKYETPGSVKKQFVSYGDSNRQSMSACVLDPVPVPQRTAGGLGHLPTQWVVLWGRG